MHLVGRGLKIEEECIRDMRVYYEILSARLFYKRSKVMILFVSRRAAVFLL
jgi:hypothetical protein